MSARKRMPDFTGRTVKNGQYKLVHMLGAGSYGVVYRAVDLHWTSTSSSKTPAVAIKIMDKNGISPSAATRLEREVVVHRKLSYHRNIVTMHAAFVDANYWYLVLEYCPGGDLFGKISDDKLYYRRDALVKSVFLQLLDAVEACHRRGIFHRDLKPENVLTNSAGTEVYLTDFGLATGHQVGQTYGCGSAYYMSPGKLQPLILFVELDSPFLSTECIGKEQGFLPYSNRTSDIWALGILLINIITSRSPWNKAVTTDDSFCDFLLHENYLCEMLPISKGANSLFRQIFAYEPSERITIPEMRKAVVALDTFFATDEEIARAPEAVRVAASYCGNHIPASDPAPTPPRVEVVLSSDFEELVMPRAPNPDAGVAAFVREASDSDSDSDASSLSSVSDGSELVTPASSAHESVLDIPQFQNLKLSDAPTSSQKFWRKVIPRGLFSPRIVHA